jgi:hypothetical protein
LTDLATGARSLTPAVRALRPAAHSTTALLQRLPALVRRADPLLRRLRMFSDTAPALTKAVPGLLCELNPALRYLAPYHADAGAFFANAGMSNDVVDANGRTPIAVIPTVDANSLRLFDSLPAKSLQALLSAIGAQQYKTMQYNPYPAPGTVDNAQAWDGNVPVVKSECR